MTITPEQSAKLREPFPPGAVGKLPRVTCRPCSQNKQQKHCDNHQRQKCRECNNYITTAHMHLDYVGHAEVTDRLLQVDPEWTWEPMGFGQDGLPAVDRNGGLWIRLTVAGVTRPGYGDAQGKEGPDAVKESIGDALRNAAMRFGVALDLWGAHGPAEPEQSAAARPAARPAAVQGPASLARSALKAACTKNGWDLKQVADVYQQQHGETLKAATDPDRIAAFTAALSRDPQHLLGDAA
jgi:hypothetical protein